MAKPSTPAPRAAVPPDAESEIHIIGLKQYPPREKIGPPLYAVVTGTSSNPVIDKTPEPLEYAAEMLKRAIHHMLDNIGKKP